MEAMRDVQVRLFVGVLAGIFLGMLVAEALPQVIWWFAIPIGGVLGGTVFAAPEIRSAAPVAARFAWQSLTYLPQYWQQYRQMSQTEKLKGYITISFLTTLVVIPFVSWFLFATLSLGVRLGDQIATGILTAVLTAMYIAITLGFGMSPILDEVGKPKRIHIFLASPIGIPAVALYAISTIGCYAVLQGVRKTKNAVLRIPWVAATISKILLNTGKLTVRFLRDTGRFVVRFSVELFWAVNSDPLAITTIGSGLGVGMFFPLFRLVWQWEILYAAFTGAVIGAFLAVLYYQFIPKHVLNPR